VAARVKFTQVQKWADLILVLIPLSEKCGLGEVAAL
jgi:hypothetical protein